MVALCQGLCFEILAVGVVWLSAYRLHSGLLFNSQIGCYRGFALAWKCLLHSGAGEKDR